MSLKVVDQVLNGAIVSLLYGSPLWLIWAFSRFLVTRSMVEAVVEERAQPATAQADDAIDHPSEDFTSGELKDQKNSLKVNNLPVAERVHSIICAPVDWKLWKVSDLRKADIAKACSVRIRPIGSRRNLSKADLVAQYKQNLKRFTKAPPKTKTVAAIAEGQEALGRSVAS